MHGRPGPRPGPTNSIGLGFGRIAQVIARCRRVHTVRPFVNNVEAVTFTLSFGQLQFFNGHGCVEVKQGASLLRCNAQCIARTAYKWDALAPHRALISCTDHLVHLMRPDAEPNVQREDVATQLGATSTARSKTSMKLNGRTRGHQSI